MPEAGEDEGCWVDAFLHGDLADGLGHVGHRDGDETFGEFFGGAGGAGGFVHLGGERGEFFSDDFGVEGLVAVRAEDRGEMVREDFADQNIGVGDGERAAFAVGGGAGVGAGTFGPHAEAGAVE